MTTKQLAVYLLCLMAVCAVFFGLVPPLLNAHSTLFNSIGGAITLAAIFTIIVIAHSTLSKKD